MTALSASPSPWIPEDDLLLKNAVEAGASLEALAKGAVRFSRKFTVRELQDRWRSLLYDPDASAEASSRMVHLQLSSDYSLPSSSFPSRFLNYSGGNSSWIGYGRVEHVQISSIKRKVESIRRIYNATRKKSRCNYDGCLDLYGSDCGVNVNEFGLDIKGCCNDLQCVQKCVGRESVAYIGTNNIRNTIDESETHNLPVDVGCCHDVGGENMVMDYGEDVGASSSGLFECDFASITDALMNFDSGDDVLEFIDVGENNVVNNCDGDELSSLLVTVPNADQIRSEPVGTEIQGPFCNTSLDTPNPAEPNITSEGCCGGGVDSKDNGPCLDKLDTLSVSSVSVSRECNEEMECILNTEDQEIPCNDDFVPPKRRPTLRKHVQNLKKDECTTVNYATHPETSEAIASPINRYNRGGISNQDGHVMGSVQVRLNSTGADNTLIPPLGTEADTAVSLSEDEDQFEQEVDVPSFSDVESMILEMDLCPDDSDSLEVEASRYLCDDSKRTIVRLEQSARSFIQRRISSRGAFAVLYGRYLKHYIKETEVILGRATEDMDVDIDLSAEGPANKISRRQALIKLETDGSFLLKNLGKSLMFVNGIEVITGQSVKLKSICLIEIRGLAFVFEIDLKGTRHHILRNLKEKNIKSEWSD